MIVKNACRFSICFLVVVLIILFMQSIVAAQGLEASSVLLKVSLNKGDSVTKFISISSDEGGLFELSAENIPGVVLSEVEFNLEPFEQNQVGIQFSTGGLSPGVSVGRVRIDNMDEVSIIPIIFEVESEDVFFDANLNIPAQFTQLEPGESLIAQLTIFDLTEGLGPTTVDIEYLFYSLDGNVLSSETENIVVDGQTTFTKTVTLPFDIEPNDYIYTAVIRYGSSVGTSSSLFNVVEEPSLSPGGIIGSNFVFVILIAAFLIIFLSGIGFFSYLVHDRNKLIVDLRKYNAVELSKQRELLLGQVKVFKSEKSGHIGEIKREARRRISELKAKHNERLNAFRKLRKKGNIKDMKRKLVEAKEEAKKSFDMEIKARLEQEKKKLLDTKKIKFGNISEEIRITNTKLLPIMPPGLNDGSSTTLNKELDVPTEDPYLITAVYI